MLIPANVEPPQIEKERISTGITFCGAPIPPPNFTLGASQATMVMTINFKAD